MLFFCVFAIYSNTFHAAWHMDDLPNIVNNRPLHIENLRPHTLWQTFFAKPGHFGSLYRPVACLTFALNWLLGENDTTVYHATNISIHAITAFLIYLVVIQLFQTPALNSQAADSPPRQVALLCALLWAVHPLQTQAVDYIVQRMAQLSALFYLLAMLLYLKGRLSPLRRVQWSCFISCGFSAFLGIMSKENATMLPLTLFLLEVCFFRRGRFNIKTRYLVGAGCIGAFMIYVVGVNLFMGGDYFFFLKGYSNRPYTPLQRLLTETRILWLYLSQLVLPLPGRFSIEHDIVLSVSLFNPLATLPATLGIVSAIGIGILAINKHPVVAFGILFFFLNHLIESSIIGLELVFEHRNYLPDIFLFFPFAMGICRIKARIQSRSNKALILASNALLVLLVVALGSFTYIRNQVWLTGETLWLDALKKAPNSARAVNTLAIRLAWAPDATSKQIDKAIELFKRSLSGNKSRTLMDADIFGNIANLYSKKGNYQNALEYYQRAIAVDPDNIKIKADKAYCLIKMGKFAEAFEISKNIAAKDPRNPRNLNLAGFTLLWLDAPEEALSYFQKALHIAPDDFRVLSNIGSAMARLGHYKQADWFFKRAIQRDPENVWRYLFLVENNIKSDNYNIALHNLKEIVKIFPIDVIEDAFDTPKELYPPFSRQLIQKALSDLKQSANDNFLSNKDINKLAEAVNSEFQ